MKKSTEELLQILKNSPSLDQYLAEAEEDLIQTTLSDELQCLFALREERPAAIFRVAGIEKSYGYDILSGKRRPARDKVLAIICAMQLSPGDAQDLLKKTGYPPLYAKNIRDAAVLFALERRISLTDLNEMLYDLGEPLIT